MNGLDVGNEWIHIWEEYSSKPEKVKGQDKKSEGLQQVAPRQQQGNMNTDSVYPTKIIRQQMPMKTA
jgi:hypothetical protein